MRRRVSCNVHDDLPHLAYIRDKYFIITTTYSYIVRKICTLSRGIVDRSLLCFSSKPVVVIIAEQHLTVITYVYNMQFFHLNFSEFE